MNCTVLNLAYFDFLKTLEDPIVNEFTGTINGAMDEWIEGVQCSDRLRLALMFDEDDNYCELQEDKYQLEFIFKVFSFIAVGG